MLIHVVSIRSTFNAESALSILLRIPWKGEPRLLALIGTVVAARNAPTPRRRPPAPQPQALAQRQLTQQPQLGNAGPFAKHIREAGRKHVRSFIVQVALSALTQLPQQRQPTPQHNLHNQRRFLVRQIFVPALPIASNCSAKLASYARQRQQLAAPPLAQPQQLIQQRCRSDGFP